MTHSFDIEFDNEEKDVATITIFDENGDKKAYELIVAFELKDTGHEYVVYTDTEHDANDNVTVYCHRVDRSQDTPTLLDIPYAEWPIIKHVLHTLAQRN